MKKCKKIIPYSELPLASKHALICFRCSNCSDSSKQLVMFYYNYCPRLILIHPITCFSNQKFGIKTLSEFTAAVSKFRSNQNFNQIQTDSTATETYKIAYQSAARFFNSLLPNQRPLLIQNEKSPDAVESIRRSELCLLMLRRIKAT